MTASFRDFDVFTLCKEQTTLTGELPLSLFERLSADLTDHTGALAYTVSGRIDEKKRRLLSLRLEGSLPMVCQRCAEPIAFSLSVDNTLELVHREDELDDEEDELNAVMEGRAGFEKIVGSKQFDLINLIEDEAILALPLVIAHEVCPHALPMSSGEKSSPFDALWQLKP